MKCVHCGHELYIAYVGPMTKIPIWCAPPHLGGTHCTVSGEHEADLSPAAVRRMLA